ncbi:hypothetical protein G9470_00550 [Bacteroides xylanolyticus]|uniref:ParA family protein n=2 Tax=Lacrimispora defluvii TaxID=2719233 RepID=A0ABX1VJC8_9FIRM|nr:hypothetical protein [Lacrimispora defluvii]
MNSMLLYTWKDVERCLLLNKDKLGKDILDIEVYFSEVIIYINNMENKQAVQETLYKIFENKYIQSENKILLDIGTNSYLSIFFETSETGEKSSQIFPLFKNVLYNKSAYEEEMVNQSLPGSPVIAFHSYKGGVGRTLSLLAFLKAWSSLTDNKDSSKLLIVDSDIEAPGLTWLTATGEENPFSYLDLLEVIQGTDDVNMIVELVADKISQMSFKIETDVRVIEHIVLPTYRYVEQLLDMYSSPESIANSYNKKFILGEVLSKLGSKLNAAAVLVDLRAGISEFSAPLLFDPRVKKYLVTSTSFQSIKGTELLLREMNKGLPLKESTILPEIFLTMIPDGMDTTDIISSLIAIYDNNQAENDEYLTDNLVTELPFASELVHLESLKQIMNNLESRDFYKKIYSLVKSNYIYKEDDKDFGVLNDRDEIIKKINNLAYKQINAEGNVAFNILMTSPINNLIKKFKSNIPSTVIMGAKGSGKTFLYRELLRNVYWESFIENMEGIHVNENHHIINIVPILASNNATGFNDLLQLAIEKYNKNTDSDMSNSVWLDNRNEIKTSVRQQYDSLEWKQIWENLIIRSLGLKCDDLSQLDKYLETINRKVVLMFDGLEEIFINTLTSKNEKNAILGLCQELVNELRVKYKNIGCIVFLRKDLARDSIEVNFEQFSTLYNSVELKWSRIEALRLVVWLVSQAVPGYYNEQVKVEEAPQIVIEKNLTRLWGDKLGKATSNEAYSSRWILAALSDFNGQLQARDIIRFLQYATSDIGKTIYEDRYIMPAEIKRAVPNCSNKKIDEVKQEIAALKPIFDKLEHAPEEKKTLPFYNDTFGLTAVEEKLMKQEGYLKVDNDKYYLPEIIRHALKFRYEKGARPKVLSLLLK